MTDKPADVKDKVDPKLATAEKIENKSPSATKTKKKKKNKDKPAEPLDDDAIHKLVDQKLKEIGLANEEDKDLKKIKKKYKALSKLTPQTIDLGQDDTVKLNKLVDAVNQLADLNSFFEEHSYILERLGQQARQEIDIYAGDITKMANSKTTYEKYAREVQKNNSTIKDLNKKFVEEETQKREDIIKSFETTLSEVTTKLEEEKEGARVQGLENEKLRKEFEEKISKYEEREKQFFDQIQGLDTKNNERTMGVLGHLKDLEPRAKEAFAIHDEVKAVQKQTIEDKMKVSIYSQRFGDLENTFQSTGDVLSKFKGELIKSGTKTKSLYKENQELTSKTDKMSALVVELFSLNEEVKKRLENSKKEKDVLRDKCNAIQTEIQAKTKRIQEFDQQKASS